MNDTAIGTLAVSASAARAARGAPTVSRTSTMPAMNPMNSSGNRANMGRTSATLRAKKLSTLKKVTSTIPANAAAGPTQVRRGAGARAWATVYSFLLGRLPRANTAYAAPRVPAFPGSLAVSTT